MADLKLVIGGAAVRCDVERDGDEYLVRVGEATHRLRLAALEPGWFRLSTEGGSRLLAFARQGGRRFLHVDGHTVEYTRDDGGGAAAHRRAAHGDLSAPMPGTVTQVLVQNGEQVAQGQPLVVVEAMKMEHVIRAPHSTRVRVVRVRAGDQIDGGTVVAEIEGGSDEPPG
jgi:acetyl-CoA/propionyl-CoA carboxylase, biotin carboxylase, biotin carboxyl carrier protein